MADSTRKFSSMIERRFFVTVLLGLSLSAPMSAVAEPHKKQGARSERYFTQPSGLSRKDAARQAKNATQGRVIAIKPINQGSAGYSVRLVVEGGRVVTVKVDQNGKVHRR